MGRGFFQYVPIIVCLLFSMVMSTCGGGSSSGAGIEPIDEQTRDFISSEITHNILGADLCDLWFGPGRELCRFWMSA